MRIKQGLPCVLFLGLSWTWLSWWWPYIRCTALLLWSPTPVAMTAWGMYSVSCWCVVVLIIVWSSILSSFCIRKGKESWISELKKGLCWLKKTKTGCMLICNIRYYVNSSLGFCSVHCPKIWLDQKMKGIFKNEFENECLLSWRQSVMYEKPHLYLEILVNQNI